MKDMIIIYWFNNRRRSLLTYKMRCFGHEGSIIGVAACGIIYGVLF